MDEQGNECPATLGEYRDLCVAIGGEDCRAVAFLDDQIKYSSRDLKVVGTDRAVRAVLMPMLVPEGKMARKSKKG